MTTTTLKPHVWATSPSGFAHLAATTPDQRARELANIERFEAEQAEKEIRARKDAQIKGYLDVLAIQLATIVAGYADKLNARSSGSLWPNIAQANADRGWAMDSVYAVLGDAVLDIELSEAGAYL